MSRSPARVRLRALFVSLLAMFLVLSMACSSSSVSEDEDVADTSAAPDGSSSGDVKLPDVQGDVPMGETAAPDIKDEDIRPDVPSPPDVPGDIEESDVPADVPDDTGATGGPIGAACDESESCESGTCFAEGMGAGRLPVEPPGGLCTVFDCTSSEDDCGADAICAGSAAEGAGTLCLATCQGDDDCREGWFCADVPAIDGDEIAQACLPVVTCDDQNPCTDDTFDAASWACAHEANTASCNDGDPCTTGDVCADGECQEGDVVDCSNVDSECTFGVCNPANGTCDAIDVADGTDCDDDDPCTIGETCLSGECAGPAIDCDDDNVCTADSCDPLEGCVHPATPGDCDDGDACTTEDSCNGGLCVPGATINCEDASVCNGVETCNSATGECVPGVPTDCGDGIDCTVDSCEEPDGCVNVPDDGLCGPPSGQCVASRVCDATSGCVDVPAENGTACSVAGQAGFCTDGVCSIGCDDDAQCDDGIECTVDACDPALNECFHAPNDANCDDGRVCNGAEVCNPLVGCQAGAPFDCDDGIDCTVDLCDAATDACRFVASDSQCTDDDPCTVGVCDSTVGGCVFEGFVGACDDADACTAGESCGDDAVCDGGAAVDCDDANECTIDSCDSGSGCTYDAVVDGTDCTVNGSAGTCQGGLCATPCTTSADCDDGVECTSDQCNPQTALCVHAPQLAGCDDEVFCNGVEFCHPTLGCQDGPAVDCDDGVECTIDSCDEATGACAAQLDDAVCDDGNACTIDACEAGIGCSHSGDAGTACDDGDPCTENDVCTARGACGGGAVDCGPPSGQCRVSVCNPANGACEEQAAEEGTACDDGDPCTEDDVCDAGGVCQAGTPKVCGGGEGACTTGTCDPATGECIVENVPDGSACDDGVSCTDDDACLGGACVGDIAAGACNDANPCTADSCDLDAGACVNTPLAGSSCDDGSLCTTDDFCSDAGVCTGQAVVCADPDEAVCITGACDPATGACVTQQLPVGTGCDDETDCTIGDACDALGRCIGEPQNQQCEDNDPCTDDVCFTGFGCQNILNPGAPCNDTDGCTVGDLCNEAGVCVGQPRDCSGLTNPCGTGYCDVDLGDCAIEAGEDGVACDDGFSCTSGDTCESGFCIGVADNTVCNDDNLCTTNRCEPDQATDDTGCVALPNTVACDDENACTVGDRCEGGACAPGSPLECVDLNPCTDEACDTVEGCVFSNNTAACDDGDACTDGDVCADGDCTSGAPLTCDNGEFCDGVETCDSASGCVAGEAPDCDDDIACTVDDCDEGGDQCTNTPDDAACNDDNVCTEDTCSAVDGCVNAPLADGTDCAPDRICIGGVCSTGCVAAEDCDDGIECTVDACVNNFCEHTADDGICDDDLWCTGAETCNPASGCRPGVAPNCNDNVRCTVDTCDEDNDTCANAPDDAACSDGNACTDDVCNADLGGCENPFNTDPCSDGNACTDNDVCASGQCNGTPVVCDDGLWCTGAETCDPAVGCVDGVDPVCDDGVACTRDSCDDTIDACVVTPDDTFCDDQNSCTTEVCLEGVGCYYSNNSLPCDDGLYCTANDRCGAGACTGQPRNCGDGIACTVDSCDEDNDQCANVANDTVCQNGQFCDGDEVCDPDAGGCVAGPIRTCNDDITCTADACDEQFDRCLNLPFNAICNDGLFCNGNEICDTVEGCVSAGTPCDSADDCQVFESCTEGGPGGFTCRFTIRDRDEDGYADAACGGDDCDDLNPDINPGMPDFPDDDFVDSNCDSIDGSIANAIFLDVATGDDQGPGSIQRPVATFARALSLARTANKSVYVSAGTYTESLRLFNNSRVFGGYLAADGWSRSADNEVVVNGGNVAVARQSTVAGTIQGILLERLTIHTALVGTVPTVGVQMDDCANVTLRSVSVTASGTADGRASYGVEFTRCSGVTIFDSLVAAGDVGFFNQSTGGDSVAARFLNSSGVTVEASTLWAGHGGAGVVRGGASLGLSLRTVVGADIVGNTINAGVAGSPAEPGVYGPGIQAAFLMTQESDTSANSAVVIAGNTLVTPDADAAAVGMSTYAMFIRNAGVLTVIEDNDVTVGAASDGLPGQAGVDGQVGRNGTRGGNGSPSGGFCGSNPSPTPGVGGTSPCTSTGGAGGRASFNTDDNATDGTAGLLAGATGGGAGGAHGDNNGGTPIGPNGAGGTAGDDGALGDDGARGTGAGTVTIDGWSPSAGAAGTAGATGAGGGGGGGGAGDDYFFGFCSAHGGAGGGGGGGGCGGGGGLGGTGGGGSFGIFLLASFPSISGNDVTVAGGGDGGAGGLGGAGGDGGEGGAGGNDYTSGTGADSGDGGGGAVGGDGGDGGSGGGGGGGPCVGVFRGVGSDPALDGNTFDLDGGGAGGASDGNPGEAGATAEVL